MNVQYQVAGSQMTLAKKCEFSYWLTCGADGLTDVRLRDYQNFSDRSITKFSKLLGALLVSALIGLAGASL